MSLSNNNIVTREIDNTPANIEPENNTDEPGWLSSLNPFSSNDSSKPDKITSSVNNIESDIKKSLPSSPITSSSDDEEESSWFSFNFKTISMIIIILLFFGFNVLKMAGVSLEFSKNAISGLFGPVVKNAYQLFGMGVSDTIKKTSNMSATGTKEVATLADNVVQDTIDEIDDLAGLSNNKKQTTKVSSVSSEKKTNTKTKESPVESKKKPTSKKQSDLESAFDKAKGSSKKQSKSTKQVKNDDAGSIMQRSKGSNKSGWCYIGEDNGFRSCMHVTESEKCMSGDIFPSKKICVNPTLRE